MLLSLGISIFLILMLRTQAPVASAPIVERLHQICLSACPRTAHEKFLAAVVCGESFSVDGSTAFFKSAFIKTGLIHLLVVSGSHLICLEQLGKKTLPSRLNSKIQSCVTFLILFIFTLMTGAAPPVLRSLFQWVLKRLSLREGWNWSRTQTVSIAGFLTAAFCKDRFSLCSLFLSWIAALALGFVTYNFDQTALEKFKRALRMNAGVYLALVPALLPLGVPSLWSIVCNLLFAPVMGLILFPISLAGFFWNGFAWVADQAWTMSLWAVSFVANEIPAPWERIEVSHLILIPYVLLLTLWLLYFKNRPVKLTALCLAGLLLGARPASADELIVWNIGQGSWATLRQQTLCQHFDIGGEHPPLKQITAACADKQNEVFFSHWDWDHIGLTREALKHLPNLCVEAEPGGPSPNHGKESLIGSIPHCMAAPLAREIFLSRPNHLKLRSANDYSQVFVEDEIIFPGDSPSKEEGVWSQSPLLQSARILIAGHHGSKTSTSDLLLRRLPRVKMIVASARKARYGHPHPTMLARARRAQLPVIITEDWGSLHFELKQEIQRRRAASGADADISNGISKSGTLGISVPSSRRR